MSNIRKANRASKTKQSTNASKNKAYLGQHDTVVTKMLQNESITGDKIQNRTIPVSKLVDFDGVIGDIKSSLLDEAAFIAIHGSGWVSAVGQDVTGSKYHELTGRTVLPDMRARFLRGVGGTGDNIGPVVGETQGDTTKMPSGGFSVSTSVPQGSGIQNGQHRHSITVPAGWYAAPDGTPMYLGSTGRTTGAAGSHTHTAYLNSGGDFETRPVNVGVNFFVKIN